MGKARQENLEMGQVEGHHAWRSYRYYPDIDWMSRLSEVTHESIGCITYLG